MSLCIWNLQGIIRMLPFDMMRSPGQLNSTESQLRWIGAMMTVTHMRWRLQ